MSLVLTVIDYGNLLRRHTAWTTDVDKPYSTAAKGYRIEFRKNSRSNQIYIFIGLLYFRNLFSLYTQKKVDT
jgi:hypothetical protein